MWPPTIISLFLRRKDKKFTFIFPAIESQHFVFGRKFENTSDDIIFSVRFPQAIGDRAK